MKPFLLRASAWMLLSSVLLLAACAPSASVQNQVLPTLIAISAPTPGEDRMVLQGRYFGDGIGETDDSYVLVAANMDGTSGIRVEPTSWTPSRIELRIPDGARHGFVFVVANGVRSNGLPPNFQ